MARKIDMNPKNGQGFSIHVPGVSSPGQPCPMPDPQCHLGSPRARQSGVLDSLCSCECEGRPLLLSAMRDSFTTLPNQQPFNSADYRMQNKFRCTILAPKAEIRESVRLSRIPFVCLSVDSKSRTARVMVSI
jgi:hypothetical protein